MKAYPVIMLNRYLVKMSKLETLYGFQTIARFLTREQFIQYVKAVVIKL